MARRRKKKKDKYEALIDFGKGATFGLLLMAITRGAISLLYPSQVTNSSSVPEQYLTLGDQSTNTHIVFRCDQDLISRIICNQALIFKDENLDRCEYFRNTFGVTNCA